ncbi:MAG: aspartyl protease family protein [bacterium]|nr:aspartyl protease family protein [bacterium]MCY3890979.1 aspartyl protease family protein [bacterium]
MGTFALPIRVAGMDGGESREIEAIVDTGAAYTTLPGRLLRDMGVAPIGQRRFLLADGRRAVMEYGRAWVTVEGESEVTLVVFGEDEGPVLLGVYTLEGLALAVDPVEQRLVPTQLILYRLAS